MNDPKSQHLQLVSDTGVVKRGGPPDNGDMEARLAKVEASVSHLERDMAELRADVREIKRDQREDFRLLFGAIITVSLGLAALMAKGFNWL